MVRCSPGHYIQRSNAYAIPVSIGDTYDVCACKLVYVYSTYAYGLSIVYTHIPVHIHTVQKIKNHMLIYL